MEEIEGNVHVNMEQNCSFADICSMFSSLVFHVKFYTDFFVVKSVISLMFLTESQRYKFIMESAIQTRKKKHAKRFFMINLFPKIYFNLFVSYPYHTVKTWQYTCC